MYLKDGLMQNSQVGPTRMREILSLLFDYWVWWSVMGSPSESGANPRPPTVFMLSIL